MRFCISLLFNTLISVFPLCFLKLSGKKKFYEDLGVRIVQKVVQNGVWINKMNKRSHPSHQIVTRNKGLNFLKTTKMYERFHWMGMMFFLFLPCTHFTIHNISSQY
ncbi:hypothetical protein [Pedobacter psychrodurus]|uniref:glycosyl-4,4'-diaponeurosporenoate acyltransferase CrtO family protein n=1 Tax=Pedobacter psychrodurus TaxID=2530456 RepID=UPI0039777487